MDGASILRALLVIDALGMSVLAVFYLRKRHMPLPAYIVWGLLALGLPFAGPFLVIAVQPGEPIRP